MEANAKVEVMRADRGCLYYLEVKTLEPISYLHFLSVLEQFLKDEDAERLEAKKQKMNGKEPHS